MLSLVEQLHNFLAEWQANQERSGKLAVIVGTCDLCGRERYTLYDIQVDATFCSPQCAQRYSRIFEAGRVSGRYQELHHASQK